MVRAFLCAAACLLWRETVAGRDGLSDHAWPRLPGRSILWRRNRGVNEMWEWFCAQWRFIASNSDEGVESPRTGRGRKGYFVEILADNSSDASIVRGLRWR